MDRQPAQSLSGYRLLTNSEHVRRERGGQLVEPEMRKYGLFLRIKDARCCSCFHVLMLFLIFIKS